jgi:hypothetical protein
VAAGAYVRTAFNDTGYNVIDIGTEADPDLFSLDLDVSTIGLKFSSTLDTASGLYLEDAATCVVTFIGENEDATAGSGFAFIHFQKIG